MPSTPTIESGVGTRAIRHTIRCTLSEINADATSVSTSVTVAASASAITAPASASLLMMHRLPGDGFAAKEGGLEGGERRQHKQRPRSERDAESIGEARGEPRDRKRVEAKRVQRRLRAQPQRAATAAAARHLVQHLAKTIAQAVAAAAAALDVGVWQRSMGAVPIAVAVAVALGAQHASVPADERGRHGLPIDVSSPLASLNGVASRWIRCGSSHGLSPCSAPTACTLRSTSAAARLLACRRNLRC